MAKAIISLQSLKRRPMKMKILYWSPRILAIVAILFMMVFSLDCFDEGPVKDIFICFIMHNIPAFILIAVLIISWKWELIGGFLFVIAFIAAGIFFKSFTGNPASLIVIAPFLVTGALFLLHHFLYLRR
jgi:hypothetical protein